MRKRIFSLILCLVLLLSAAVPAFAEEAEESAETAETEETVTVELAIRTADQFLRFAESCRMDSYSRNLSVFLEADIDLTGVDFTGVPIFSGAFDGRGHTISGLELTADGSVQGLFRYLTAGAVVRDLHVQGSVQPGGSRGEVGGIAGSNAGWIVNCSFSGTVSGGENVGGLAGTNTVTGVIENCRTEGTIHGSHFVGGVAGRNSGVIRGCENSAQINTTAQQNTVGLSDITLESLTNSETVNTVTDIGGIAGTSSGVIRACVNYGGVGYQHMGYNIGGIAGTQSGYILDCENYGKVLGRKEVGGIVGQLEPTALVEYDEDALQILEAQLGAMGGLVGQTAAGVQSAASDLNNQMGRLQDQVQDAKDAVNVLIPDKDDPTLPDLDSLQAAQNNLSSSLSGMKQTVQNMGSSLQNTINTMNANLNALQNQINAMSATLGSASEYLGGSITDVSDLDTELDLTGKVEGCVNFGDVLADTNAGGVTGAIALENDLDPEDDWQIEGTGPLNFESELRAVVLGCTNSGAVTATKQNAGGIVGWQYLGLVKNCVNTGALDAEGADYVGGITGRGTGYIRLSSAKCELTGAAYVGGIAGSATIVTDCRSMVRITGGSEKLGAVLGLREEEPDAENPIAGNSYVVVDQNLGGIDGISYAGQAEPMELEDFLALEDLPEQFAYATVSFLFADGTVQQVTVAPGGTVRASQIPAIPEKEGFVGQWEGLAVADLSNILLDMTFEVSYTAHGATIQSSQTRANGLPILLLQGDFTSNGAVVLKEAEGAPILEDRQTLLEAWSFSAGAGETLTAARFQLPEDCDGENIQILVLTAGGSWKQAEHTQDGSYLVFSLGEGDSALALVRTDPARWPLAAAAAAAAAVLLAAMLLGRKKHPRKPKPETKEN